ncbi:MAG: hypothetical protein K9L74_05660 [Candidatus Izimaplasma sp.]|nr:hypothetical protein [Candidatus Izimaplasma bacterium]
MSKNINDYLEQHDSFVLVKKSCELVIDLLNYKIDDNLLIDEDKETIWLDPLMSKINFGDISFNIVLDYANTIFFTRDTFNKDEDYITINYNSGDTLLQADLSVENIKEQVRYTERLLGGKVLFKDTSHLFNKVYRIFGPISDMDLVHMEVLLSQTLRAKKDPGLPARMIQPFDPIMLNIKEIPFKSSYVSGLLFENIGKAINQGLVSEEDVPPSILERLFTGDLT